ncbi:hypothetical protein C8A05DRAFT_39984 [Staphylotrichum tortipilum]|uniref:Uncharacterized protein n=1 Tax=Staphylotrichum tortipilum TaxID=2831512 RepID=A0AAN6RML2_9PEZI|nr:hypothetical protein C8A05DRAFT_39984 [Staphylotrichum longicolle]
MDLGNAIDAEAEERIVWSTTRLYLSVLEAFPKHVQDFQTKWRSWQETISPQDASAWDDSAPSFKALTALGPKIIPLVIYQLAFNPTPSTALHLYSTLDPNPSDLPRSTPTTTPSSHAEQILLQAFTRNRAARDALANWTEHCERVSRHSSLPMYTECTEYDELLALGPAIVPHVMLQYAKDVKAQSDGVVSASGIGRGVLFWYELLHELVWGRKTGVRTVVFGEMYEGWKEWFDEGEWEGAPRFGRQEEAY